jgi:hypothetical protein
MNQQSIMKV